jgi:hypothetical protein
MARRTCPPSGWPPASARVRPPDTRLDTVPADQFLLRTPPAVAGRRRTGQTSPPSGRPDTPVQSDRLTDGSGPGPDGERQAADTSSAQRPPMRLAIRPRGRFILTLTGQDGHAHARLRQPQALPAAGPDRHDHLHPCSMPDVRKPGPRPLSERPCPASTMDATLGQPSGHRRPDRIRPDTVHSTRHAS